MAMRSLDLIPARWLDREPPSLCHTGLEVIGTIASIGGTLVSAIGGMQEAKYQSALARNQSILQKQQANEAAAVAQREAITQDRKTGLVESRARALAAGSGTLATSPTQIDLEQGIAEQGGYNTLATLYQGMAEARSRNHQADIELFKARRTEASIPLAFGGKLLAGLGDFADRKTRRGLFGGGYLDGQGYGQPPGSGTGGLY